MNGGRQEAELTVRITRTSAVMCQFQHLAIKSGEVVKAKFATFDLLLMPILTYGHEFWVITKRMQL